MPVSGIPSLTKRTAFAVSEDTTRPMLKCVNLIFGADGLQAVSTDSFRIASAKGDRESRGNISFLVPAASLEKLAALVDNREKLQVGATGRHIVFTKEHFSFAARVMDGPYLSVSQVLSNLKQQFTVLTDAALLRLSLIHIYPYLRRTDRRTMKKSSRAFWMLVSFRISSQRWHAFLRTPLNGCFTRTTCCLLYTSRCV